MTTWTFDEKRFREEVFKAMAEGWAPSENLFRCYQLPVEVDDADVIARARDLAERCVAADPQLADAGLADTVDLMERQAAGDWLERT